MTHPLATVVAAIVAALGSPTEPPEELSQAELLEQRVDELERSQARARRRAREWQARYRAARWHLRHHEHRQVRVCCDTIVELGARLQAFGYRVGEHPAFGGVAPVHDGWAHDVGLALDVNAAPGASPYERARLRWLAGELEELSCVGLVLYPDNDPEHYDHLHAEWACA